MTSLRKLAVEKYREDGLFSLVLSAPLYVLSHLKALPERAVNAVINRGLESPEPMVTVEQIQRRCADEGRLWEFEGGFDAKKIREEILSQRDGTDDSDYLFQVRKEAYDWFPRRVCELQNAAVFDKRGLVADFEGKLVLKNPRCALYPHYARSRFYSSSPGTRLQVMGHQGRSLVPSRKPTRIENAMSMVAYPVIYGHWLQEYLPMLLHLSVYEENTGRKPDIIINNNPADWMLETLRVLGYDEDRIVEWDNGFAVVDRLVLPTASRLAQTPHTTQMSPVEYRWLRERFLESVDGTDTSKNERFYISRQGMRDPTGLSGERYVTNFDEMKPVLDDFDIEVVRPETMSIDKQVRKFSRGGIFVGPRGSGLHNTLFAKNAKTLEIYTPNTRHHIQQLFDYALGHEWTYVIGSEYDKSTSSGEDKNMPFRINPDVLRKKLEEILSDNQN